MTHGILKCLVCLVWFYLLLYNCNLNFILFNKITIPITATAKNADHNIPGHPYLRKCGTITIPINAVT